MKKFLGPLVAASLTLGPPVFAADAPVTFSVFSADTNNAWAGMQDDVGKQITARTGVTLKVEFPVGSADQRIALIAASGKYPDLILPKGQTASLVQAGALLDLTVLIDRYAPNIKAILGDQLKRLRYSTHDKAIYFIPNTEAVGQVSYDTDALFKLQLDALKEARYPRVETLKDYEAVVANYVKKHPVSPDGQPTIGMSLLADDWRIVISTTNPAVYATGQSDDGEWFIDPQTLKAREHYFRPEERDYFRWLNHMNAIGLLDQESFIQKYDQYKAKIAQGRIVGLVDSDWDVAEAINTLKAQKKFGQTYGRFGVVTQAGIKPAYNQHTGFNGAWGIGITKSCKDPVRAIRFLDWLASDEGQVLNQWGIEGKHYRVVAGKRVIPAEVMASKTNDANAFALSSGIGNYSISLRYGDGVKDKTGNYYTAKFPETILEGYSDAEKTALKAYGVTYWNDLLPPSSAFPVKAWGAGWSIPIPEDSILKQYWNKEQAVVRQWIPEAILAPPSEFDRLYDSFLAQLHLATGAMAEAESALVRDRIALWTR